jgi:hypothetical protein
VERKPILGRFVGCRGGDCAMKYELWKSEDAWTFFPLENHYEENREMLEQTATLTWTVEATSYNEAMKLYYDFMGWGDYQPMEDLHE